MCFLINIYIIRIMTTQNDATVPYLFLFFNQGRVRDFQNPVLLDLKCIVHVISKQDQWTSIYVVFLFVPR